ncbi:nuclear transport factor 2 family protein [Maribacter arcticus]|uniref:nuclear transport factor 2 family protein n=1 Tax=Maribacter arcticus TaxID=561365 RepID=UPI0030D840A2|tara:strand:- start:3038 stop:3505 length:468 start_codon:yes stop_codon:yes gene_type:complete
MKLPLFFIFGLMNLVALAQTEEEIQVKQNIIEFFDAFHAKDSIAMKKTVYPSILLQTIGVNNEGKSVLKTENFNDLVKSIISIPDSTNFQELIKSYSIQTDGNMANAWTPYEFWINNEFHHCGVNSFQLFREENKWKIIYLIDTRRKSDCSALSE